MVEFAHAGGTLNNLLLYGAAMSFLLDIGFWEVASYVVTTLALPFALYIFLFEQRKERDAEDEEAYQLLQDAYNDFLKIVLDNPDLRLRSAVARSDLSADQKERTLIIYEMLIALFERAYIVSYVPNMRGVALRRWHSWDDYMREWCRREDFYYLLPQLLRGEDQDFADYIRVLAEQEHADKLLKIGHNK
jgi:hypothetical protein